MSKKLSAVLCVSLIIFVNTRVGRAALVANMTKIKDPSAGNAFNAPEAALPAPWVAYQLSVQTTVAGELIGAVDIAITGNKLHQRWDDIDFDAIVDPSPQHPTASDGRGDSHLTAPAGSPFGLGPTETNTKSGSPLTSIPFAREYGIGNLAGAWALLAQPTVTNIAYLVFKSNDLPVITIKSANPAGLRYNDIVIVPEPTALALLGMGLVGGLSFLRRRFSYSVTNIVPMSLPFGGSDPMLRNHSITLIVSLASILLAAQAQAVMIGHAFEVKRPLDYPFLAPETALSAPWVAYRLRVQSTAGELFGAVDVRINGNKLHQRWFDIDFDGVADPSANNPNASNGRGDSHLTAPIGSPFGLGPTETNTKTGSPLASTPGVIEYGLGNLSGAWGIPSPNGTTANIAYIVTQDPISSLDIRVLAATPAGGTILSPSGSTTLRSTDFTVVPLPPIPEPSTIVLSAFALAGLAYVRRRPA